MEALGLGIRRGLEGRLHREVHFTAIDADARAIPQRLKEGEHRGIAAVLNDRIGKLQKIAEFGLAQASALLASINGTLELCFVSPGHAFGGESQEHLETRLSNGPINGFGRSEKCLTADGLDIDEPLLSELLRQCRSAIFAGAVADDYEVPKQVIAHRFQALPDYCSLLMTRVGGQGGPSDAIWASAKIKNFTLQKCQPHGSKPLGEFFVLGVLPSPWSDQFGGLSEDLKDILLPANRRLATEVEDGLKRVAENARRQMIGEASDHLVLLQGAILVLVNEASHGMKN
ncbi:hypothetical protein ACVWXN_005883 [Bradyrhizobium sp. i1.4.4]